MLKAKEVSTAQRAQSSRDQGLSKLADAGKDAATARKALRHTMKKYSHGTDRMAHELHSWGKHGGKPSAVQQKKMENASVKAEKRMDSSVEKAVRQLISNNE